jgi:hypothetical protein
MRYFLADRPRQPQAEIATKPMGEKAATERLRHIVGALRRAYSVESVEEGEFAMTSWVGKTRVGTVHARLRFTTGTDLSSLEARVSRAGGVVHWFHVPTTYRVCVLTREPDLERARHQLSSRYPYVTQIQPCLNPADALEPEF